MKKIRWLLMLTAFGPPLSGIPARADDLTGIESRYSAPIAAQLLKWPPEELRELKKAFDQNKRSVALLCFRTPGNDLYLGIAQYQTIAAPFERAVSALDDVPGYVGIFDDLAVSRIEHREPARWLVFSEQHIGIPLVPNEKNEIIYWVSEQKDPRRKIYRYQLKGSNHLKFNDGFVVVEAAGPEETDYTEYDFYDADWSVVKAFGHDRIWKANLRGIAQADLAIRLKAEHPDWGAGQILKTSLERAKSVNVEACLKSRRPWPIPGTAENKKPPK